MLYVGIDIASEKHDCCILAENEKVLEEFSFPNNAQGFSLLVSRIASYGDVKGAKIGLEATGIYGENLSAFLRQKGFEICTFNPLIVKKRHSATTLRKTKTDKSDARFLASQAARKDFQPDLPISYHTSELKSLARARFHLIQRRSAVKNRAKGLIVSLFPEFISLFSDTFGSAACAVLKQFLSAREIAACPVPVLAQILSSASRGMLDGKRAEKLHMAAEQSVGVYSGAKVLELQLLLEEISLYTTHAKRIDAEIRKILRQSGSTITTIPGIGPVLAASILGEIGDIHRFSTAAKLVAYAGLEPSVYSSGKFAPSSGAMVKRGSPYLRYALFMAARSAAQHDALFGAYMHKKLSEGKHYSVAASHTAKKLTRILFPILKNNSSYSPSYSPLAA